ncbi:hypothetical protein [Herpetosiphon geysericola]|uniref:Uncharacterized protein n=1 Tax=Herpetosiphon geysericola TaxID=70996 RepID=A0A0P6XBS7_9CHLR|nr:hypothetical protein [Herpetosiphon geysericola]KPL80200.1 hypothetical protein SE18_24390 [Herpetosiphon geysericola]
MDELPVAILIDPEPAPSDALACLAEVLVVQALGLDAAMQIAHNALHTTTLTTARQIQLKRQIAALEQAYEDSALHSVQ